MNCTQLEFDISSFVNGILHVKFPHTFLGQCLVVLLFYKIHFLISVTLKLVVNFTLLTITYLNYAENFHHFSQTFLLFVK